MESFIIDHLTLISKKLHDNLEVLAYVDILGHDVVVTSIQKQFPEKFD
jgi:hypothetical protein